MSQKGKWLIKQDYKIKSKTLFWDENRTKTRQQARRTSHVMWFKKFVMIFRMTRREVLMKMNQWERSIGRILRVFRSKNCTLRTFKLGKDCSQARWNAKGCRNRVGILRASWLKCKNLNSTTSPRCRKRLKNCWGTMTSLRGKARGRTSNLKRCHSTSKICRERTRNRA